VDFPIGFGTWPLGGRSYGPVKKEIAVEALEESLIQGIRLFDTADIYGDGRVEKLLGQVLAEIPDAKIISKAGYITETDSKQDFSESHIRLALKESLQRLRREKLYIFLLHSPTVEILKKGQAFKVLDSLRQEGLVTKTGVSLRTLDTLELVLKWPNCQVIEVIFNLLDQRPIDVGLLDLACERGIEIIARVPLCFGLLSGKYKVGHKFPEGDQRSRWPQEQIDAWIKGTEQLRFLEHYNRSLTQAALAFCISLRGVKWVIPGMKTREQVQHNATAGRPEFRLTDSEIKAVRHVWYNLKNLPPS